MSSLRNLVFIALAQDATPDEVENAHIMIDKLFGVAGGDTGINPALLVAKSDYVEPSQQQQAPQQAAQDTTTDAAGFPWDERIHSSNKKLNDKGLWWAKRGVTPALKAKVEAELRATLGAAPQTAAPPQQQVAPPQTNAGGPPMPGANLPPMPGAAVTDPAYTNLVQFIAQNTYSPANPAGKLNDDYVKQVLTHYGVADGSLQNLAHRADLVPTIHDWLNKVITGQVQ